MKKITHNEAETKKIARSFTKKLTGGEIVLLSGDLGVGKTTFVKGIGEELAIKRIIKSPTFSLLNIYDVKKRKIKQLIHIDCYRLDGLSDLEEIGVKDYFFDPNTIIIIEWPERIEKELLKEFLLAEKKIFRLYFYYKKEKEKYNRVIESKD